MPLAVNVTPGKQFADGELVTNPKLNQLGQPTFTFSGTVGTSDLETGAVTAVKSTPGAYWYTDTTTFAANTYTGTLSPALAAGTPVNGTEVWFKAISANAGATSANLNGTAFPIKKNKGEALVANDIRADQVVGLRFDGTNWQMFSQLGVTPSDYVTAGGTDTYTVTLSPAPTALAQLTGRLVRVSFTNANTSGTPTLNPNALGAGTIKKYKDQNLLAGDIKAGQVVDLAYDGANWQMQSMPGVPLISQGQEVAIVGATRGLILFTNFAAGRCDVTADDVVVKTSGGLALALSGVSLVIDISAGAVGAGGFDVAWASAAWYYVWVIYKPSTAETAGLLSLSATNPTLPTGYTYYGMVGGVRVPTGTTFTTQYQLNRRAHINSTVLFTAKAITTPGTYQNLAGADLTAFQALVPPIAKTAFGSMGNSTTEQCAMAVAGDASGLGAVHFVCNAGTGSPLDSFEMAAPFEVPLKSSQNFYWNSQNDALGKSRIMISGYTI